MKLLVLGVGNVLMRDESLGVRAVDEIQRLYDIKPPEGAEVELLDGGTSGVELLDFIRDKSHLIMIDAIKGGHPPGTVVTVSQEDIKAKLRVRISPHQLGVADIFVAASLTGEMPPNLVMYGIEPKDVSTGLGMSDEVKASMGKLIDTVIGEIKTLGYEVTLKKNPTEAKSPWEE